MSARVKFYRPCPQFRSSPRKRGPRLFWLAFYVYILASQRNGTLYIGYTDSISRRAQEHRESTTPGFTAKYGVKQLVYYEVFEGRGSAFARERAMKKWRRAWKVELIERFNLGWRDLFEGLPLE